jgi:hypothetical protein
MDVSRVLRYPTYSPMTEIPEDIAFWKFWSFIKLTVILSPVWAAAALQQKEFKLLRFQALHGFQGQR